MDRRDIMASVAEKLAKVLPGPEVVGEPFWVLMEVQGDQVTGSFHAVPSPTGGKGVCLFLSSANASKILAMLPDQQKYAVRGLSRQHMEFILAFAEQGRVGMELLLVLDVSDPTRTAMLPVRPDEVRYFAEHGSLPDKKK